MKTTMTERSAQNAALSLLGRQSYTAKRLADKLFQKGYGREDTEEALAWCVEHGYVDDAAWAARAAERKSQKGWGSHKIIAYLRYYGISRADISAALENLNAEE